MCCRVVGKRKKCTDVCDFKIYKRLPQPISHLTLMIMLCSRQVIYHCPSFKDRDTRLIEVK